MRSLLVWEPYVGAAKHAHYDMRLRLNRNGSVWVARELVISVNDVSKTLACSDVDF